ncbi:protein MpRLK-Pelle_CR4L1 [Marchantia polymorpha subsp. ruderalis]|uniref:Protein kinase domain-containing protein n=2 Tax=Marchantia polymorpha TaxID=3197 RepID=A0AAF6AQB9_MARPO|nr:hypothetical protein MARPO_0033s0157 [Marchantia polymorpha]BBM98639.1 hypothetical protein Mp_1g15040 [Marchantia polymorpha subsp. ruderalis]|eukprot:PTQ41770.1 hypothetical protein MARPO_0033s0157 [Marchantia polymorpha]
MGYLSNCAGSSAVMICDSCKTQPSKNVRVKVFKATELLKATQSFSEANLLGKGSHSCVYRGTLADGRTVAVKRPTVARRGLQDVSSFDNELEILSKLQHRHLVNLIGYSNETPEKLLVVEFMGNGTLYELLHGNASEPLSWPLRVHMALQAAKALAALHSASPPIIHRDIKSSNVLVDASWNAKVGDLGLALRGHLEDVVRQRTPPAGTMGYIDPEYETPSQLSTKSDVFSFGILLLEIMSGRNAIDVRYNPSSIVDWAVPLIKQGKALSLCDPALKPPQNAKAVKQLAAIAARCVRLSRDRRPSMADVVEGLRTIRKKVPLPRFGGKPARNSSVASNPAVRAEATESLSASSSSSYQSQTTCQSQSLSIFDEGSIIDDGDVSLAESLIRSHTSIRKRLRNLSDSSRVSDSDLQVLGTPSSWRTGADPLRSSFSGTSSLRREIAHSLGGLAVSPQSLSSRRFVRSNDSSIAPTKSDKRTNFVERTPSMPVETSEPQPSPAQKAADRRTLRERGRLASLVIDYVAEDGSRRAAMLSDGTKSIQPHAVTVTA